MNDFRAIGWRVTTHTTSWFQRVDAVHRGDKMTWFRVQGCPEVSILWDEELVIIGGLWKQRPQCGLMRRVLTASHPEREIWDFFQRFSMSMFQQMLADQFTSRGVQVERQEVTLNGTMLTCPWASFERLLTPFRQSVDETTWPEMEQASQCLQEHEDEIEMTEYKWRDLAR